MSCINARERQIKTIDFPNPLLNQSRRGLDDWVRLGSERK